MNSSRKHSAGNPKALFTIIGGVMMATSAMAQQAQDATLEEVIVTGVRASMKASMDLKRDAVGVVDSISAEDMGKFPDSNLAESLQRVTGVSIDRVNGEGTTVTARGFGPGYNMVTLNGRTMPTANVQVVGFGGDAEYGQFTSRAFDFSNLASEGVTRLEVHKTGFAAAPSGGIGATINVVTMRPLDNPGTKAMVGVKAMYDTSTVAQSKLTPEVRGLFSWSNDGNTFGVSAFGSYQKRHSAIVGASNQDWNVESAASFLDPNNGRVRVDDPLTPANEATVITNPPDAGQLVAYPNNSDYFYSEFSRERVNGQLTVQFRPIQSLTLTADALIAQNKEQEQRSTQGNWFNRPFAQVIFDGNTSVASAVYLQETLNSPKDIAWGQQLRDQKSKLQSFGFNANWKTTDRLTLEFDAHSSKSESTPDGPGGKTSYDFGTGVPAIAQHSLDLRSGFPVQMFTYDDSHLGNGNAHNGIIDLPDVSTSVARTSAQTQTQKIDEFRLAGAWEMGSDMSLDGGVDYRKSTMDQSRLVTAQILGDWGVTQPGDILANAPGLLSAYCLSCLYDHFTPGMAATAFRGNAAALNSAMSPYYLGLGGHDIQTWNDDHNTVEEDITAAYAHWAWKGELGGRKSHLDIGLRYEKTDVKASTQLSIPTDLVWTADNDFALVYPGTKQPFAAKSSYNNTMPNIDFSVEVLDNVVARASVSKTIARTDYGNLFVADSAGTPPRATALGGIANGGSGNTGLVPLESKNIDLSLEVYYANDSYVSLGLFNKQVTNFVGTGYTLENLFGLRDPSSGAPGTRSGDALAALKAIPGAVLSDVNLSVMTNLYDNPSIFPNPTATYLANSSAGSFNQAFADNIFATYDVHSNSSDPLLILQVKKPLNQKKGSLHGVEFAFQHFFGRSGFGVAGSYTFVDGDIAFNNAAGPNQAQYPLLGLSNTANGTLIYEKRGISARLSYNWRDAYLDSASVGSYNNPRYYDPYHEIDLNIGYDVTSKLQISFEGINLTGEDLRSYGRAHTDYWLIQQLKPRYLLGARYKF